MKKLLLILNTHAGRGALVPHLAQVLHTFTRAGYLVSVYPTQGVADATAAAKAWGGDFDRVVCAGGDGTLHEVIAGLLSLPSPPPLGYLPCGSTNDFAQTLSLSQDPVACARIAARSAPRPCDVGVLNGKSFVYVAAFGAFTQVAYTTPQEWKHLLGHLAYVLEGVAGLSTIKSHHLSITHDGEELEGEYIYASISNTLSVGGFHDLPLGEVVLDDGLFEVMLVKKPESLGDVQSLSRTLLHHVPPQAGDCVQVFHTGAITLKGEEAMPWTLDGEYGGSLLQAEIQVRPRAIELVWGE